MHSPQGAENTAKHTSKCSVLTWPPARLCSTQDVALWRRLAAMSTEAGFFRQAIYCLCKVVQRAREDLDAQWDRAVLYAEIGETRRALDQFEAISKARLGDPEVPKMQARLLHRMNQPDKAIELLERCGARARAGLLVRVAAVRAVWV